MKEGLIDEIYRYNPDLEKGGRWNEKRKRNSIFNKQNVWK